MPRVLTMSIFRVTKIVQYLEYGRVPKMPVLQSGLSMFCSKYIGILNMAWFWTYKSYKGF